MSCGEMWSKICHVETFLQMINVETNLFCHFLRCFVSISALLPCTLYWRKINFVAIYALLWAEFFLEILCMWRKKDKYEVCSPASTGQGQTRAGEGSTSNGVYCCRTNVAKGNTGFGCELIF